MDVNKMQAAEVVRQKVSQNKQSRSLTKILILLALTHAVAIAVGALAATV